MPDYEARLKVLQDENDQLRERVAQLEEAIGLAADFSLLLPELTPSESTCLGVLLNNKAPRKLTFQLALYGNKPDDDEAEIKIIDVMVCKLRKKLKPLGVEIGTSRGEGYFMDDANKSKLRDLMAA